jgi:hypothetical protein
MTARLVYFPSPMMPEIGAQEYIVPPGISVRTAIALTGIKSGGMTMLLRRDMPEDPTTLADIYVPFASWTGELIHDGDTSILIEHPQAGGAASAIAVALAKMASYAASTLIATFPETLGGSITFWGGLTVSMQAILTSVIFLSGSMLITSLIPGPKSYTVPNIQAQTYSLSAQQNLARLGAAVPTAYGRNKLVCDVISQPWYDFVDGRQRVMQLFTCGEGYYDIEAIRAGDGVIWRNGGLTPAYSDVEIEVCPPGTAVTLFDDNVVTSPEVQGIEALGPNQEDHKVLGPFVCSKSGTRATKLQYDVFLPSLGTLLADQHLDPATVSWRVIASTIDDEGNPTSDGEVRDEKTLTLSTKSPIRKTYEMNLPGSHRWQVTFERTNNKSTDNLVSDTLQWLSLRTFLPSKLVYNDVTVIAVRGTGTVNLNGNALQNVNVIATRKLPIYNPETKAWTDLTPTRKIAAAVSHCLRAVGGMADKVIDLDLLWGHLDATWTERGDTFDFQFGDRKGLWQDALEPILSAGRARPLMVGNRVTFFRDEPKAVYDGGMFTPLNMVANTFTLDINLTNGSSMDALVAVYRDQVTWTEKRVLCKMPWSTATLESAPEVQFLGAGSRAQAYREGMFRLADGWYRRRRSTFTTTREGTLTLPGQKALLSHYIADFWGKSAAAEDLTAGDTVSIGGVDVHRDLITLSEPWSRPINAEGDNVIAMTTPDGKVYGPVPFELVDDGSEGGQAIVRLMGLAAVNGRFTGQQPRDWPLWDAAGQQKRRPRCNLGVGTLVARDIGIVTMSPEQGGRHATIGCFIDNPLVHTADQGEVPGETIVAGNSDLAITAINVSERIIIEETPASSLYGADFTIVGAPDAVSFDVRWQFKDYRYHTTYPTTGLVLVWQALTPIETGKARTFTINAFAGTLSWMSGPVLVRVYARAINADGKYGSWFPVTFYADGRPETAPPNIADVKASRAWDKSATDPITYYWPTPRNASSYIVHVIARRRGDDGWATYGEREIESNSFVYSPQMQIDDGGPWNNCYLEVKAKNSAGMSPNWAGAENNYP